jgi:pimeloyl-ACP methyl ester carboxylesterase
MPYQHDVVTPHETLAVEERGEGKTPVLLIHGNFSCRGVFRHRLEAPFAASYRMIAFDLPRQLSSAGRSVATSPLRCFPRIQECALCCFASRPQ